MLSDSEINSTRMETEDESKLLLSFALPGLGGMLSSSVYDIVNRLFIGNIIGSDALAAIAVAFPTILLFMTISFMIGVGSSSVISIFRGEKLRRHAERALSAGLILLAAFGLISILFALFLTEYLVSLSCKSAALISIAVPYLKILLFAGPVFIASLGISFFIKACGAPKYAMTVQVISVVLNIILDFIFLVFLKWGINGAAWATVISKSAALVYAIRYFFLPQCPLRLNPLFFLRPSFKFMKRIMAIGLPSSFIHLSIIIFMTLMNRQLEFYGGEKALAVMGIFLSIDSLLFLPAMAFGDASQPIIGYNYGAGKNARVLRTMKFALVYATVFYAAVFIFAELFSKQMIAVFNSSDKELIEMGSCALRIGYIGIIFSGITQVTGMTLQALAKVKESLILAIVKNVLLLILPALILPRFFGLSGAWMVYPVADISGALVSFYFLRKLILFLKSKKKEAETYI